MKIDIFRTELGERSTPGKWSFDGVYFCDTLELPWHEGRNAHDTDCFPPGIYPVTISFSHAHSCNKPEILNVPNRLGIRVDVANYTSELKGCVAVGMRSEPNEIFESQKAYDEVFARIRSALDSKEPITLEVHNPEEPK